MPKLQKISLKPLAKLLCVFHAIVGLILGIIAAIGSAVTQQEDVFFSLGAWSILAFPLVNAGIGYLTGIIIAWAYNVLAKKVGGVEYEIEENI